MTVSRDDLVRSALTGAATGGRTTAGIAALSFNAPYPSKTRQPDKALATHAAQGVIALMTLGEFVADKLPSTPSRLDPGGLPGRLVLAAACGVVVARRRTRPLVITDQPSEGTNPVDDPVNAAACAGVAMAASFGAAVLGVKWRAWAGGRRRTWRTFTAAAVEDVAVLALAGVAARA